MRNIRRTGGVSIPYIGKGAMNSFTRFKARRYMKVSIPYIGKGERRESYAEFPAV